MIMKQFDVVALGELLIDFTDNGLSTQGNPMFEANPGGAPCNVLSELTKLGRSTAFIGKVGNDPLGKMLKNVLEEVGIDHSQLKLDDDIKTTLAFVLKKEDGDRDFAFYRKPGADIMLKSSDIDFDVIKNAKVFHFGSLSLTDEPVRSATIDAISCAKESGALISFDPNLREPLWDSLDDAKKEIDWGLQQCDFLKISDNEIVWFTGKEDYDEGIEVLRNQYPNIKMIALSLGKEGSRLYWQDHRIEASAFLQEGTIETTGAGDTFCACLLNGILTHGLEMSEEDAKKVLTTANAAASIVTTRKGALKVMPTPEEINELLNK